MQQYKRCPGIICLTTKVASGRWFIYLKRTVSRDFSSLILFNHATFLVPIDEPRNDFDFFSNFCEVISIRIRLSSDEYTGEGVNYNSLGKGIFSNVITYHYTYR